MSKYRLKIFVVEDDQWYSNMLVHTLTLNPDYEIKKFLSGKELLDNLHENPDIITLDYKLPDIQGDKLLKKINEYNPDIAVIIVSCQEDIETAVGLLKEGAFDYIVKNGETRTKLLNIVNNVRENGKLKTKNATLRKEEAKEYDFRKVIKGQSSALEEVFFLIRKAVNTNITVSITGETGTGKELVAKAIHYGSSRSKDPFIPVNVAAIPKDLIESELFGHEKGAFTGASCRRIGKFEEADGGTIFLDEIAELDINMQVKLLRVLQEREVIRVGGNKSIKFNARLITATNKNLAEEVQKETFRKDLFYRIIGLPIELPPLRERDNDILILANYFINAFTKDNGMHTPSLATDAKDKLLKYNYPGNVRELKSFIDLACVMCNGIEITAKDISFNTLISNKPYTAMEKTLKEYNKEIISFFLEKYHNNVMQVADKLDIGKSTIYNMMKLDKVLNN